MPDTERLDYRTIDEVIHGRVRLAVMAYLSGAGAADFGELRTRTGVTDGNLSVNRCRAGCLIAAPSPTSPQTLPFRPPRPRARAAHYTTGAAAMSEKINRVVLAYSGGLDTSVILKWLQQTYQCEVVTFTADLGQGEELEPARRKAEQAGVKPEHIFIDDLRETFVKDYVFPMMRANALYEGLYLLGTSIARPLIAKRQIEIARMVNADAVSHGATGKGNDQVRFELGYYALAPDIKVIAPWREWDLTSRTRLIEFAEQHQIPVAKDKRGEAPFSTDANMLHTSSEGKVLEDPWQEVPDYVYSRTVNPEDAPDQPEIITVDFEHGDGVALNGEGMSPATLLEALNELGRKHGIGRLDLVENRFVGMKSRGMYETPGGTIYHLAHRGIEQLTLDRGAAHLKDELAPRYAELVYNGFWFSPEREMLQAAIDHSQDKVTGTVRLKLYKGGVYVIGRKSPYSLYSEKVVTFEDDQGAYDQRDAAGFIKLNALRLRLLGRRDQ
jgi:argininosuccinate synthase